MRAEVDADSGLRSRPHSGADMSRVASTGNFTGGSSRPNSPMPDDDQAEWARQEQQVHIPVPLQSLHLLIFLLG